MLDRQIVDRIRLGKLEPRLERFLGEPHATFTRTGPNPLQTLHTVSLQVAGMIVASATSSKGYVDALGAALWALDLWRESVTDELDQPIRSVELASSSSA